MHYLFVSRLRNKTNKNLALKIDIVLYIKTKQKTKKQKKGSKINYISLYYQRRVLFDCCLKKMLALEIYIVLYDLIQNQRFL